MRAHQIPEHDWMPLPGGELEAPQPKTLCPSCRDRLAAGIRPASRTLCFACYQADIERDRKLKAAGNVNTATDARFQFTLPFEPVNVLRLERLRAERMAAAETSRIAMPAAARRRSAQIAARRALQRVASGLVARQAPLAERNLVMASAIHAAELQLPDSWIPFVVNGNY